MGLGCTEMEDVVNVMGEQRYVTILWRDLQPSFMYHTPHMKCCCLKSTKKEFHLSTDLQTFAVVGWTCGTLRAPG